MEQRYLSIPEFAARLGISRIAVFKKVKKGKISAFKVGKTWVLPQTALKDYFSSIEKIKKKYYMKTKKNTLVITEKPKKEERETKIRRTNLIKQSIELPKQTGEAEMEEMGWD